MRLDLIKEVVANKITALQARREHHLRQGDLDLVASLDTEIAETQATAAKLESI